MNQTFKKKVIAASLASAFVLVGAGVVSVPALGNVSMAIAAATTTTVGLRVDSDKDALSATRRTLNLGVLGLDASGNVDVYGAAGGSTIIAEVSSVLGTVVSGAATPATAAAGSFAEVNGFAASANYITLAQGAGLANVTYAAAVSGTDTVTVRLFERRTDTGGNAQTTLIGTQAVQATVVAGSATTGVLHISAFAQGTDTTSTAAAATATPANEAADDGIGATARVVAGTSGSTLTIKAFTVAADRTYTLDTNASGAVTVTLTGVSTATEPLGGNRASSTDTYTLTGTMSAGVATITWPASVTKAGVYKIVATLGSATSVPSKISDNVITTDRINVIPSTVPAKLGLAVDRTIVSKATTDNAAAAAGSDGYDLRPTVTASLLDTNGNKVDPTGSSAVTVKVTDANAKISDFNVTIGAGASFGTVALATTGLSVGTASMTASIANNPNIAASSAASLKVVSDVNQLCTVASGAAGYVAPNAAQTAGVAITNFLLQGVGVDLAGSNGICAGAELDVLTSANRLTIKSLTAGSDGTYESVTVGVTEDGIGANVDGVGALFKKALTSANAVANGFLISDPDGSYADYKLAPATGSAIAVAAGSASTAYLKDYQGNVVTSAKATRAANGTYSLVIDGARLSMTDANGNAANTGSATATTVKGVASGTATVGTAGSNITLAYAAGTVGPDTVTINFSQPGVSSLTLSVDLVGASALSKFTTVSANTEIPVNAVVPLTILPQDANGANLTLADGFTVTYPTGVTVTTAAGGALASGSNVGASSGATTLRVGAGSVAGDYKVTVSNTAGTVTKDVTYTVKQYTSTTPVAGGSGGATVTGAITSQTISTGVVPATADQGKQGSVFVAAILPNNGGIFFMDSNSNWTPYSSCATAPVYKTGTLASIADIKLLPASTDLSSLVGTDIYTGYGIGGVLSPAGTACNNMIANGSYSLTYTIK